MVIFVLDDIFRCQDILDAWKVADITGIIILESSGLGRVRRVGIRDDLPLIPSLSDLFKRAETRHRTLFTVVKDQAKIDALVKATQSVVGDLERPNTGFCSFYPSARFLVAISCNNNTCRNR